MTADMGPVISAVDEYGDQRYAEGQASRQAEVDRVQAWADAAAARVVAGEQALAALRAEFDAYRAAHPDVPTTPPPAPVRTVLGMSAPADKWDQRLREVGPDGVTARRIFGSFTSTGRDQANLIEAAVAAGMLPVVSYKGSPSAANIKAVHDYLASLNVPVCATWHHEPRGDMTAAEFVSGSRAFLAAKSEKVQVGPILNGWLLDRKRDEFLSFTAPDLFKSWDFLGIDSYQSDAASTVYPGHRIAPLLEVLADAGRPDMPVVVGEYNGFTAAAIDESGRVFLECPNVKVACVWNSGPTGLGTPLEGDRLAAFKATKSDPRVKR